MRDPDSPQSQSPSYQAGYDSGTSGLARNTYGEEFDTSDVGKSEQYACSGRPNHRKHRPQGPLPRARRGMRNTPARGATRSGRGTTPPAPGAQARATRRWK
jgi:hypothetical protein